MNEIENVPHEDAEQADQNQNTNNLLRAAFQIGFNHTKSLMDEIDNEAQQEEKPNFDEKKISLEIDNELKIFQKNQTIYSSVQCPIQNKIRKSGFLLKKSPHFIQGYQKRYCTIKDRCLRYYLPEDLVKPFGILDFRAIEYDLKEIFSSNQELTEFILIPKGHKKEFQFKSEGTEKIKEWIEIIKSCMNYDETYKNYSGEILKQKYFWKIERITNFQFENIADSGDILLFKSKNKGALIQRNLTGSEYDHVALIVRYEQNHIFFYEAVSSGVGFVAWSTFTLHKWNKCFHKVVYRRLTDPLTEEQKNMFNFFIHDTLNKKYSCNILKFLHLKSTTETKEQLQPKETYFCSQLVADFYKKIGLLELKKASCQYWPGNFECKKEGLKLISNGLEAEQIIDFI